jgi:hypothetical protein
LSLPWVLGVTFDFSFVLGFTFRALALGARSYTLYRLL